MCCRRGHLQGESARACAHVSPSGPEGCKALPGPRALTDPITCPRPIHSHPFPCFADLSKVKPSTSLPQECKGLPEAPGQTGCRACGTICGRSGSVDAHAAFLPPRGSHVRGRWLQSLPARVRELASEGRAPAPIWGCGAPSSWEQEQ